MTATSTAQSTTGPAAPTAKPFGLRDKIGYAFGDLGNDFTFILAASFLMIFYTNVLGVGAAIVGTIMMAVRLVDAFVDVAVGRLVDRSPLTARGRFRPWIARFAIPVAAASVAMYAYGVSGWSQTSKIAYIAVTYLLWSVLYSVVNIPYGSMAAVISSDPNHRASLSVFRTAGAFGANVALTFIVPLIIYTKDAAGKAQVVPQAFFYVALVGALLSVGAYYACYGLSTERVQITKSAHHVAGMGRTLASLVKNRAMVSIVGAALLLLIAMMLNGSLASYLWVVYFNNGAMQSIGSMVAMLPTLLLLPFATKLAKRFGKREVSIVGTFGTAAIYILLAFLPLHHAPAAFIALTALAGFGMGAFNVLVWAFITDVIDHQEVIAGHRDDGVVYSVYSWARKVGQALAAGLGGWALGTIGYKAGTTQQADSTVQGIYQLSTSVPGVLFLGVALVLLFGYPLSKQKVLDNAAELVQRHAEETK